MFSFQDLVTGLSGVMILLVLVMVLDVSAERVQAGNRGEDPLDDTSEAEAALEAEIRGLREELEELKQAAEKVRLAVKDEASAEAAEAAEAVREEEEREGAVLRARVEALRQRLELVKKADAESREVLARMDATRRDLEGELVALRKRAGVTLIPERGDLKMPVYVECAGAGFRAHRPLAEGGAESEELDGDEELRDFLDALDRRTHSVVLLVRPSGARRMGNAAQTARELGFAVGRDPLEEGVHVEFGGAEGGGA